jgi:hypothetical protein
MEKVTRKKARCFNYNNVRETAAPDFRGIIKVSNQLWSRVAGYFFIITKTINAGIKCLCFDLFRSIRHDVTTGHVDTQRSGVATILKGGSFSQKSRVFTVNFKDFFLCSRFSQRGLSHATPSSGVRIQLLRRKRLNDFEMKVKIIQWYYY